MELLHPVQAQSLLRLSLATLAAVSCLATAAPAFPAAPAAEHACPADNVPAQPRAECPRMFDVILQPDGLLRGRILDAQGRVPAEVQTGLSIRFVHEQKLITRVRCDASGRFAATNLRGGVYQIVVEHPLVPSGYLCRAWSAGGAPPHASPELALVLEPVVVRGRAGFWLVTPPGFITTALTAGAIAGPIIYHNTQQDNRAPHSP